MYYLRYDRWWSGTHAISMATKIFTDNFLSTGAGRSLSLWEDLDHFCTDTFLLHRSSRNPSYVYRDLWMSQEAWDWWTIPIYLSAWILVVNIHYQPFAQSRSFVLSADLPQINRQVRNRHLVQKVKEVFSFPFDWQTWRQNNRFGPQMCTFNTADDGRKHIGLQVYPGRMRMRNHGLCSPSAERSMVQPRNPLTVVPSTTSK